MPKIFIDRNSGTWGDASGIIILTVSEDEMEFLDGASDSEITDFAFRRVTD